MRPPEAVAPRVAAVVMAVVRGARSSGAVAEACGCTRSEAMRLLRLARRDGLVDFDETRHGTIHTYLNVVANTPRKDLP